MKEFIDKLISRLEEEKTNAEEGKEVIIHHEGHSLDYEFLNGRKNAFEEAIEIVNELAGEYTNTSTEYINTSIKNIDCTIDTSAWKHNIIGRFNKVE